MKRFNVLSVIGALLIGLSQLGYAAPESGATLTLGGGRYYYDTDRDIERASAVQGGIGYIINKHWALEAVLTDLSDQPFGDSGVEVDGEMYRIDALYNLGSADSDIQPYLAFGVGELQLESPLAENDETVINAGFGVNKYITDAIALRGDARLFYGDENSDLDFLLSVGLHFAFGGHSPSKAAPAAPAEPVGPGDADNDGVTDDIDQCPDTPAGVVVDSVGCPADSDGDGVYDQQDKCPDTPAGARVDENGCQYVIKETVQVELEVLFDTNKAEVKPAFFSEIQRVAEFMKLFPATNALIEGHTDSRGDATYNQQLSQRRADAVRDVLISEHGIAADRLESKGYGEEDPRASNETREGQAQNRRVIAVINTEVEKTAE